MGVLFDFFKNYTDKISDILHDSLWTVGNVDTMAYYRESKDVWGKYVDSGTGDQDVATRMYDDLHNTVLYSSQYWGSSMNTKWLYDNEQYNENIYFPYISFNNSAYAAGSYMKFVYSVFNIGDVSTLAGIHNDMGVKILCCENINDAESFDNDVIRIPSQYLQYMTFSVVLNPVDEADSSVPIEENLQFSDYYRNGRLFYPSSKLEEQWSKIVETCEGRRWSDASLGVQVFVQKSFFDGRPSFAFIPLQSKYIDYGPDTTWQLCAPLLVSLKRTASSSFKQLVMDNTKSYGTSYDKLDPGSAQFRSNGRVVMFRYGILNPPGDDLSPCVLEVDFMDNDGNYIRQRLTGTTSGSVYERISSDGGSTWTNWVLLSQPVQ